MLQITLIFLLYTLENLLWKHRPSTSIWQNPSWKLWVCVCVCVCVCVWDWASTRFTHSQTSGFLRKERDKSCRAEHTLQQEENAWLPFFIRFQLLSTPGRSPGESV